MEFVHEERATRSNHLRCLVQRAAVTSCMPNIAQSESVEDFSRVLRDTCLDVSTGRSFLNFPQAIPHLVMMEKCIDARVYCFHFLIYQCVKKLTRILKFSAKVLRHEKDFKTNSPRSGCA